MRRIILLTLILIGSEIFGQVEPAKDRWTSKRYDKFDRGMNITQYPTKLDDAEFLNLENVRYNSVGVPFKREGFRTFGRSETGAGGGNLTGWYPTPETSQYIFVVAETVYTFGGLPTSLPAVFTKETSKFFKPNADYHWTQFFDRLYGCNGKDSNFYYDWNTQNFQSWGFIDSNFFQAKLPNYDVFIGGASFFVAPRLKRFIAGPLTDYVENDLVGFWVKLQDTLWMQILRNTSSDTLFDSIYVKGSAEDTSSFSAAIWNLPISSDTLASGSLSAIVGLPAIKKYQRLRFITSANTSLATNSERPLPLIFWVYSGKGSGFQGTVIKFRNGATQDTFEVQVDTAEFSSNSFNTGSKWRAYYRMSLSTKFTIEFKNRYFYAGNYNSGIAGNLQPNLPNYLWFSTDVSGQAYYTPDWVKSFQFLNLDSRDGDIITGMTSQFQSTFANENDRLIVFSTQKIREIYVEATGFAPQDFIIFEVTNNLGCVAPRSIARSQNRVLFLSDKGLYAKDPQNKFTFLSAPIQKHLNKIKRDYISYCAGAVIGNDYFLSTPDTSGAGSGKDTINSITWIYSFITGGWTKADIGAGMWFVSPIPSYKGKKSTGGMAAGLGITAKPDTFQYLFTFPTQESIGTFGYVPTDTGKRIEMVIQTKRDDLGANNFEKRFREIQLEYSKFDTSGFYIPVLIDDTVYLEIYNDFDNTVQFADTSVLSGNLNRRIPLNTKIINKAVSFKIRTKSPSFELAGLTFKYLVLNRKTR